MKTTVQVPTLSAVKRVRRCCVCGEDFFCADKATLCGECAFDDRQWNADNDPRGDDWRGAARKAGG